MGATQGTPSLAEVIQLAIATALANLDVALVCEVLSYDAAKQTADLKPLVKRWVPSGSRDADVAEELPTLPHVRVLTFRGNGFFVHFPLKPGDRVLALCLDRDSAPWFRTGEVSEAGDRRTHHLTNAIAIPGIAPSVDAIAADADNLSFGKIGGLIVKVTSAALEVGGNSDQAALASRVAALETWANAHTHLVTVAGVSTPVATPFAATGTTAVPTTPSANGPFGSTKLKVGG